MAGVDISQLSGQSAQELKNKGAGILDREITLFSTRFTDRVKESFYVELGILLGAGVDIKAALELTESQQEKKKLKETISAIREMVISGKALSMALREFPDFTPYEYYSIQIGEETGKIGEVLNQLAQYYQKKIKQQRQFVNAISYPALIFFTSIGAVFFMLYFVVPMFSDIFRRFGGDLPYLTKVVIALSTALSNNFWLILIFIIAVASFVIINRSQDWFRRYSYYMLKRIPMIGPVVIRIQLARFCTSMALLTASRVPLLRAIQLVKQMVAFYPLQESLKQVEADLMNGQNLHASMSKFSVYDARMIALLKVGEEVNQLDLFFQKLSIAYSEEAEHKTTLLSAFLEPIMIIFLGIIVGIILVAMYLPMFQLSTSIGG
jgi:type IV pilus assembly protein PilC